MAAGDLVVAPVREATVVYRIVRGADRSAPAVLDSLRSHYERGAPPRGYERRLAVIHMQSCWTQLPISFMWRREPCTT